MSWKDVSTPEWAQLARDGMDESDYRRAPDGYSRATAYLETQYGGGFDEEAK